MYKNGSNEKYDVPSHQHKTKHHTVNSTKPKITTILLHKKIPLWIQSLQHTLILIQHTLIHKILPNSNDNSSTTTKAPLTRTPPLQRKPAPRDITPTAPQLTSHYLYHTISMQPSQRQYVEPVASGMWIDLIDCYTNFLT